MRPAACLAVTVLALARASAQDVDFRTQVRPILADRCFACHGPDAARREARLRLDTEAGSRALLPSGRRAVVPGDPDASELARRIRSTDPKVAMPPPASKLQLSGAEREVLLRWIEAGAGYREHWAFQPLPERVAPPEVADPAWIRDPLDRFVLAGLEGQGLRPAPAAGRPRWLRRVTLSLTGLPPTPDEVEAFAADRSPDAEARVVDRLLASVRHAERMTADWLEAARYADTYGYQSDVHAEVWPWRDWVIRAFDGNLPYDQFLTWQLAGDLLPAATREQRLATAFLRLHRQTNEGGSVEEEYRVEYVADRVETVGTAMLGLTLGCAKCHDHKFDPISQREYYALFALFDGADEAGLYSHFTDAVPTPTLWLPTPEQERALAEAEAEVRAREVELEAATASCDEAFATWLGSASTDLPDLRGSFDFDALGAGGSLANAARPEQAGRTADGPGLVPGVRGQALLLDGEDNASFPAVADFGRDDPFTIALWVRVAEHHPRAVVWHRSRAWTDAGSRGYELLLEDGRPSAALIHFWPGNAVRVRTVEPLVVGRWTHLAVSSDGSGRAAGLRIFVDGERVPVEVVRDALRRDIQGGGADALTIGQRFRDSGLRGGAVDELRVFARALAPLEVRDVMQPGTLRAALADQTEPALRAALREVFVAGAEPRLAALRDVLRIARRARSAAVAPIREIMTMRDDCPEPRVAFRLERGSYEARREPVEPGVPACLPPWPEGLPRDRLGFARWLTAPGHPLTARVIVNRIWQMHFGIGLSATPEDLGTQGEAPLHRELLDHLAARFVAAGFDLKLLHRWIVLSATFRQDSAVEPELRRRDPENRLLGRGPGFRLPAEGIRDAALFTAGLLVGEVGGPSVRPYQPPGLWEEKSGARYVPDSGAGLWRRSLYTYWKRTSPPPAMTTFDAGGREVCAVRRQRTSSPLQALVLWNDPQQVEAARHLAARVLADETEAAPRCERLFALVLGRAPEPAEVELLVTLAREQAARFASDPAAAAALLAVGTSAPSAGGAPDELAAWTVVASTVLACDEAITLR
jgi:mono/diheme cytochrome c family protein